uniref:Archaeal ATPase family n=1 Tax=uncultured organism TaxID=155900 RepID=M1Q2W5_9ZZZZ|nr:archaeal ATPase family [uncultured organism]
MVKKFTAKDKVLVHILSYYGIENTYTQPVEITQEGIAESVGLRQNTVSYAVRNLVKEGLLYDETHRIKGKKQKRKAYYLTEDGVEKAEKIKEEMKNTPIKVNIDGEEKEIKIGQINTYLKTNFSVIDIIKKSSEGTFEHSLEREGESFYYYGEELVVAPKEEPIGFQEIMDWYGSEKDVMYIYGPEGAGKTKFLSRFIDEIEDRSNVFYFRTKEWHSEFYLWDDISSFLKKLGEHRLSSYLEASKVVEKEQALADLKKDIRSHPSVFIIDDVHKNEKLEELIHTIMDKLLCIDDIKIVFSSEEKPETDNYEGRSEEIKLGFNKNPDNLFDSLKNEYDIYDEDKEEMIKKIVDTNLTPEEYVVLEYISLFREPIDTKEVYKLKNVNKNLLNTLMSTPLLDRTVDGRPILHEVIKHYIYDRMSLDTKISGHELAARYYSRIPSKKERKIIEDMYHVARVRDVGWFSELLNKHASFLISSGYSSSLLDVIDIVKGLEEYDEIEVDIKFYEGEAHRVNGDLSEAVSCYEEVMEIDDVDPSVKTEANHGIAMVKEKSDEFEEAIEHYKKTDEMVDALDDDDRKGYLGISNLRIGEIYSKIAKYDKSRDHLLKAIDLLKSQDEYSYLTSAYLILAKLEKGNGNWKKALKYFQDGLEYWNNIDETYQRVGGLREIGALFKVMRELKDAEDFLEEAIEISERFGYEHIKASALLTLAECYIDSGEYQKAVESAEESNEILSELDKDEELAYSHTLLGKAYMNMGDEEKAENNLNKAITIYQKLGSSYYLGLTYFSMAKLQEKVENKQGVAKNYRKAILSFSGSGANTMAERVQKEMENIPITM